MGKRSASVLQSTTDSLGHVLFDSVDTGEYRVEAAYGDTLSVLLSCSVIKGDSLVDLGADTLRSAATLRGRVTGGAATSAPAYIRVYGLDRAVRTEDDGSFSLRVPAGTYTLNIITDHDYSEDAYEHVTATPASTVQAGTVELLAACPDFSCDSTIVRHILDTNGLTSTPVSAIIELSAGRVGEIHALGKDLRILPPEVARLRTLTEIEIQNCGLASVPWSIAKLTNISGFKVPGNALTTLPDEIIALTKVYELDLGNNKLCNLPVATQQWATARQSNWRTLQVCP
jgi:hypothetical protein